MKARIFWAVFLTSAVILTVSSVIIMFSIYQGFTRENMTEVKIEATYVRTGYEQNGITYTDAVAEAGPNRITVISKEGKVLCDSYNDTSLMESHTDRPEIIDAFKRGWGESVRASETSGENTYYYALLASDGSVVRVASTMVTITEVLTDTATLFTVVLIAGIIISLIISTTVTKAIIEPINKIDPIRPIETGAYEELSPLLIRMDEQNKKINEQMSALEAAKNEFIEITSHMSEALVVFSYDRRVLSANRSARNLFGKHLTGLSYNELSDDAEYLKAADSAFSGKGSSVKLYSNSRVYRISVDPVKADRGNAAILFAEDITDTERAEQIRKEFSANVSHELKTPLTTIMGAAELMQTGIAPPEDHMRFTSQIYKESKRLLSLIEDIIYLSRLDEGAMDSDMQSCDLYSIAEQVAEDLCTKAENSDIEIKLNGRHRTVMGIPGSIHEMVYNLCDNAIKYNNPGGYVEIGINDENGYPTLYVKDNGIGIAKEYHDRIFERFYRVDKSRSKETGGTGLGLSIVKHAALLHKADLKIDSEPGKGTKISIVFPKQ